MLITAAAKSDVPELAALLVEVDQYYGDTSEPDPIELRTKQIEAALWGDPPAGYALVARQDGRLVGFASYSFLWPAAGVTSSLYLKELFVSESARRSGAGGALMQRLHEIAAAKGCSRVEWTADDDNPIAGAFYHGLGYVPSTGKTLYRSTLN